METSYPPHPPIDLATPLYYQLVYTLTDLLPPPLDDTPAGLNARNKAAIAKVAALLPVDANEVDLAAQCIAARAQAEDILRLLRQHAGDIALVTRLNAQYASMVRTSLSVHGRLMRVQAQRHKREAIEGTADQDAWTRHVAERSMLRVVDPKASPFRPAWPEAARPKSPEAPRPKSPEPAPPKSPEAAPPKSPKPAPVAMPPHASPPAARADQTIQESVSEISTDSHDVDFETWLSQQPWNLGSTGPDETAVRILRQAIAKSGRESAASGHQSPDSPLHRGHGKAATAPVASRCPAWLDHPTQIKG